jgi:hypothetical protein
MTRSPNHEEETNEMMTTDIQKVDFSIPAFLSAPPPEVAERIRRQPECRLLWAVLQEGVETYMKYMSSTRRRGKRLFAEAEHWIMQDDPTWLCSFVSICDVLGLEPDALRTGLKRWQAQQKLAGFKQAA